MSKREEEIRKEIEEREKLDVSEEHTGHWCYDDVLKAELKGITEAKQEFEKVFESALEISEEEHKQFELTKENLRNKIRQKVAQAKQDVLRQVEEKIDIILISLNKPVCDLNIEKDCSTENCVNCILEKLGELKQSLKEAKQDGGND